MSSLPERYEIEYADFGHLLDGVRQIQAASQTQLQSLDWLTRVIREVGLSLFEDSALTYKGEDEWVNGSQQGVNQLPRELARFLLLVAEHRPATYLHVSASNGATASLAAAYLQRFNSALQATAIDFAPSFVFFAKIRDLIPLRYLVGKTSYDLAGEHFEAVFIDSNYGFEWAWADYQNVGREARVCAFHDVNNAGLRDVAFGGVPAVWELVCQEEAGPDVEFVEIFEHPTEHLMGIGVRIQRQRI